jgi:hypothetical protein
VGFYFELPAAEIAAGGRVTLNWTQPLKSASKKDRRFFYLPVFSTTAPVDAYHRVAKLRNESGAMVCLGWKTEDVTRLAPHGEATLTLHHCGALKMLVTDGSERH